jgi:hypothetical protein
MKATAGFVAGIVGIIVVLFLIVGGAAWLFSFKGTDSGEACVIRQGGPFDGRDITEVRQPGSGAKPIGAFNKQDCYSITERDWVLSSNPNETDNDDVDQISVSTADAVQVFPEGQALFRLTSDPVLLRRFVRAYGRRKWDGKELSSDEGWKNFLRIRFRPVLTDALRQSIGANNCTDLNNLCQYIQSADSAVRGRVKSINNTQNLAEVQAEITRQLIIGLRANLGDEYLEGVRFQNLKIGFAPEVNTQITAAQTKRTEVANAALDAQRARVAAEGVTAVRRETAKQIALTARSYERNPYQARIDYVKALCGDAGCQNLQVLGGGGDVITNLR